MIPVTEPAIVVWWTVEQAAAHAQVGKRTIYNAAAAKQLRHAVIGGRRSLRFRRDWVDLWLESTAPQEITK